MFLTYSAVVATDSSLIARELTKEFRAPADSSTVIVGATTGPSVAVSEGSPKQGPERPGPCALLVGLAALLALAYAAPIMIGVASPVHLVIAGFALYEAWKLNRGAALRLTGPYQAAGRAA